MGTSSYGRGVYKALDKLKADGLIVERGEKEIGVTRRGAPRVVYAATEKGVAAWHRWLQTPAPLEVPTGQLQMRLSVAAAADLPLLRDAVERDIRVALGQLRELTRPSLVEVADSATWTDASRLLGDIAKALQLQAYVDLLEVVQTVLSHRLAEADS